MRHLLGEEIIYSVYILANKRHGTLYIGVTSNLISRVVEHRSGTKSGFAHRYGCNLLVYYETFGEIGLAIRREKTLKKWSREWKINLIERGNPHWDDLYSALSGENRAQSFPGLPGQARQ